MRKLSFLSFLFKSLKFNSFYLFYLWVQKMLKSKINQDYYVFLIALKRNIFTATKFVGVIFGALAA